MFWQIGRMPHPPLRIVPASDVAWADVQAVLGRRGRAADCQCQRYKLRRGEAFKDVPAREREHRLRTQTEGDSGDTTGLVGYRGSDPVGWCAVQPRAAYEGLVRNQRVPWEGRDEDRADESVWAITCFVVRTGFRRQGIGSELVVAALDHARRGGARAVEGYPIGTTAVILEELHVGTVAMFERAGFREVARPTTRRRVMRIDF